MIFRATSDERRTTRKGFSLLEVLLALVLFGTGFAVLLQIISTGLFAGSVNENEVVAANLAQERIEELRNTDYASIADELSASAVTGFTGFTRQARVTVPQTGLKQVTVYVYWYVRNTQTSMNMVTYISDV
jgi:type IV pilus assembly protein PilV